MNKEYTFQNYRENLGKDLKKQRIKEGLTIPDIAKAIDVTTRTISRIEDADYDCSTKLVTLHKYAEFIKWPFTLRLGK